MARLRALVESRNSNAVITWLLIALVTASAADNLVRGNLLWTIYSAVIVAVALVPPLLARNGTVLVAWQGLALAALPLVAVWFGVLEQSMTYLSVAAMALLVAVEVDTFSSAEMPPWFAVLFVVMTTLTVAALWGVLQYFSDVLLGTSYLADRAELMWDLVAATAVGVSAGLAFEVLFRNEGTQTASSDGVVD